MSKLLLPCEASQNYVENLQTNLQSDRHTVNKSYFQQLVDFHCSVLPAVVSDFNNLSANQLSGLVCMNYVFVAFMQSTMLGQFVRKP